MDISVIGLGKLGLPMVAAFASKGYNVTGIDNNETYAQHLAMGDYPDGEPGLKQMLKENRASIKFACDYQAIMGSEFVFIIVPTPTDDTGEFSNKYILSAIRGMAPFIETGMTIVIVSTVKLGTMRGLDTLIRSLTGKIPGKNIGLCYNPEFIALGNVINGILKPDALLIGESDELYGHKLEKFYNVITKNVPSIHRMSWENAEIAKLSLNVFITTKISIANVITEVADSVVGGNAFKVLDFVGSDSRVGKKYLKPGPGYAGPCFPRDNRAFTKMCQRIGLGYIELQKETDNFNDLHNGYIITEILKNFTGSVVSLLGVSYKTHTSVTEESPALKIAEVLVSQGITVKAYDPLAIIPGEVNHSTIKECLSGSDLAIVVTPWDEIINMDYSLLETMRTREVYDCWGVMDKQLVIAHGAKYMVLGINNG